MAAILPQSRRAATILIVAGIAFALATTGVSAADQPAPRPPADIKAADHPWDDGTKIDVTFGLSPDDRADDNHKQVAFYTVERSG